MDIQIIKKCFVTKLLLPSSEKNTIILLQNGKPYPPPPQGRIQDFFPGGGVSWQNVAEKYLGSVGGSYGVGFGGACSAHLEDNTQIMASTC